MAAVIWFVLLSSGLCGAVMAGCPPTTVVASLDLNKLMGPWFEHASKGTLFLYGLDRCKVTNFTLNSDEHTITMLHSHIPYFDMSPVLVVTGCRRSSQVFTTWTATAKSSNPDGHLTLNLKLPVIGTIEAPLMVVDTDYDNYLVLYLCRNIGFFNFNAGYILTRKRSYSTEDLNKIYASIDAALMQNKLQRSQFVLSNNKKCPADLIQPTASSLATALPTHPEVKVPEETASTSSDGTVAHSESVGEASTTDEIKTDSSTNNEQKEETESTSNDTAVQLESVDKESTDSSKDEKLEEQTTSSSEQETTRLTDVPESDDKTVGVDENTEISKSSDSTAPLLSEVVSGDVDWTDSNTQAESEDTPAAA